MPLPSRPTVPGNYNTGFPNITQSTSRFSPFQRAGIADAIGSTLEGVGQEGRDRASQQQNALSQMAGFHERAANNPMDMASRAQGFTGADQTVAPYARLALQNALIGGMRGGSTVSAPAKANMGRVDLGINMDMLKNASNQYLNNDVLGQAWHQQQANLNQMNPYGSLMNPSGMFGEGGQALYDNLNNMRGQNITNYQNSMGSAQQALQQALEQSQKGTPWWKTALSMGAQALPFLF